MFSTRKSGPKLDPRWHRIDLIVSRPRGTSDQRYLAFGALLSSWWTTSRCSTTSSSSSPPPFFDPLGNYGDHAIGLRADSCSLFVLGSVLGCVLVGSVLLKFGLRGLFSFKRVDGTCTVATSYPVRNRHQRWEWREEQARPLPPRPKIWRSHFC